MTSLRILWRSIPFIRGPGPALALESAPPREAPVPGDSSLLSELPGVLDLLNASTRQFNDVTQDQKQSIIKQSAALHQVAVTAEEILAASRGVSAIADTVEQTALQSISGCQRGMKTLEAAMRDLRAMGGQVESLVNDVRELGAGNQQISGVADIIDEITDQLTLLALNAQIEAAGAGPYGRRFMVVAEEVNRLARRSSESTSHIQRIIKKILADVGQLVGSAQTSLEATQRSLEDMNQVAADIRGIHREIVQTHARAQEIKVSTHQQTSAQTELTQTLAEVDAITFQGAQNVSQQIENAVTNLSDLAQYITLILETTILGPWEKSHAHSEAGNNHPDAETR